MVGCKKLRHFRKLSNYDELLICALEVNDPQTNILAPHVVHKNPIMVHYFVGSLLVKILELKVRIDKELEKT